jgi:hypothetical protein
VERLHDLSAADSRQRIRDAVSRRYTLPAEKASHTPLTQPAPDVARPENS